MTDRFLAEFRGTGYDKGRPIWVQALWFAVQNLVFASWWVPARMRPRLLRAFGAQVEPGVFIRHGVRVLWPWKLSIGADSWIGEGVWLLNLEPIAIGSNVCLSQEAFVCTGGHDSRSRSFEYANRPIVVEDSAWVGARAILLGGVTVGVGATVGAGVVVRQDVAPHSLLVPAGSPEQS